jgi:hypothetical protein
MAIESPLTQSSVGADIVDGEIAVSLPRDAAPSSVKELPAPLLSCAVEQLWHS